MKSSDDRARSLAGVAFVLAAACLFAVNGTVSKVTLTSGLSSLRLVELRCAAAAAVLVIAVVARRPAGLAIRPRELAFVAIYGVVGIAMTQWLYFVAIQRMPVSISLLIEFTAPVLVALWVRYVRKEPVHSRIWGALALIIAGLVLVARVWAGLTLDRVGLLAACLAALALAGYYLLGEHGLGVRDPLSLAAWSFIAAAALWSVLLPWWTFPFHRLVAAVPFGDGGPAVPVGLLVIWVVLLGTVAPFALALLGLRRIGAARAGLIGTLEPPLAGLVAWGAIGERLAAVQVVGALVVLTGIVLAETARIGTPEGGAALPLSYPGGRVVPGHVDDGVGDQEEAVRR